MRNHEGAEVTDQEWIAAQDNRPHCDMCGVDLDSDDLFCETCQVIMETRLGI